MKKSFNNVKTSVTYLSSNIYDCIKKSKMEFPIILKEPSEMEVMGNTVMQKGGEWKHSNLLKIMMVKHF